MRTFQRYLLAFTALLLLSTAAEASIKCWVNKEGIRECGNAVPPEYAQQEVKTLDNRGITTDVRPRAPTAEEVEAERQRQAEEERIQAEEAQRRREQEVIDRVLLASFLNEEDIIRTRDRMTATINATIDLTRINIDKMRERLTEERRRAANFERQGKAVPERTREEIHSLEQLILEREQYIAAREQEREQLHDHYKAKQLRFRELKAREAEDARGPR